MRKKSKFEAEYDLKEEIQSIEDKGYKFTIVSTKEQKDKRRFTRVFDIKLNQLIFSTDIDRKYINFFILLVNINSRYIEPNINVINLPIKEIAKNMEYTTVHIYNCLKVLKEHNIIDYYIVGKSNYVVINPCYYARIYDNRYMYMLEYAFKYENVSVTDIINRIIVLKNTKHNNKDKITEEQIKQYVIENFMKK